MIEVITNDATVATGASVPLENVVLHKGCTVRTSGTSSILFNKCGVYKVDVSAVATSATATTGTVGIQVARNGVLQGIASAENVGDATSAHTLALSTLVQVPSNNSKCNCCAIPTSISIQNVGNAALLDIDVVVTKVC